MQRTYLVIGVPGAGKTWVCEQLVDRFTTCHVTLTGIVTWNGS